MFDETRRRRALERGEAPAEPGGRVRGSEFHKAQWLASMRWRRAASVACKAVGLTFTQWLVLDALRELFEETDDAASQNEIAARAELDRATVSQVMAVLDRKALVSREGGWQRMWLVLPTKKAEVLLLRLYPLLDAASASVSGLSNVRAVRVVPTELTESRRARPAWGNR